MKKILLIVCLIIVVVVTSKISVFADCGVGYNCSVPGSNKIIYTPSAKIKILENKTILVLASFLLLFTLSATFLYRIFKNFGIDWWKALIPVKNLYSLVDIVKVGKFKFYICLVAIIFFLLSLYYAWFHDISFYHMGNLIRIRIILYIPVIIVLFLGDYLLFKSYYRLFRMFGWSKIYSLLGTIFFPIGAFILGFGNFQCLGNQSDKKEKE